MAAVDLIPTQIKTAHMRRRRLQAYSDPLAAVETLRNQTPQLVYLTKLSFTPSDHAENASTQTAALPKAAAMFAIKDDNARQTAPQTDITPDALTITGQACTHQTVGQYLHILQQCPEFQHTLLLNACRSPTQNTDYATQPVDFEMAIRLRK